MISAQNNPHILHTAPSLAQQRGVHEEAGNHVGVQIGGGAAVLIVSTLLHRHHAPDADAATTVGDTIAVVVDGGSLHTSALQKPGKEWHRIINTHEVAWHATAWSVYSCPPAKKMPERSSTDKTRREACLVLAGEAALIAFAVLCNVQGVRLFELLAVLHDDIVSTWSSAGALGAVVGMPASAVPVAGDGLGVQAHIHVEHLADAVQNVPTHTSHFNCCSQCDTQSVVTRMGHGRPGHPELVSHGDALHGPDLVLPLGGHHLGIDS